MYRVIQQVSDLGWVDFDLDVPIILLSWFAHSAYLSSEVQKAEVGRQWNNQNQVNPTQMRDLLNHTVDEFALMIMSGCCQFIHLKQTTLKCMLTWNPKCITVYPNELGHKDCPGCDWTMLRNITTPRILLLRAVYLQTSSVSHNWWKKAFRTSNYNLLPFPFCQMPFCGW